MTERSQILSDHKRIKKKLVPPILQIGKFHEVKWVDYILPELLWLGLLNEFHGLKLGAELGLSLANAANKLNNQPKKECFAVISSYTIFSQEQKSEIIKKLKSSNELELLQKALTPFDIFYHECPLNFLFKDTLPSQNNREVILNQFKLALSKMFDRWDKPGTFMQANAVYIAFVTDKLKVAKGISLANFPAVEEFPKTEESKRIASSARGVVNMFFAPQSYDTSSPWPKYFWKKGLELEPCKFSMLDKDNE
ncbi:MAG: hypothetical protein AABY49_05670 [Planctomycetota bacterium]